MVRFNGFYCNCQLYSQNSSLRAAASLDFQSLAFSEATEPTEGGSRKKPKWVKEAVLHEMLLEIKDYANKEASEMELDLVTAENINVDEENVDKIPAAMEMPTIEGLPMTRLTRASVSETDVTLGANNNNNNNNKHHQPILMASDDTYNKLSRMNGHENQMFTLTPSDSINFEEVSNHHHGGQKMGSSDLSSIGGGSAGISDSESPSKFQSSPDGKGRKNQDSRESLIPEGKKETWWTICSQVAIPFLIAGLGMVGAGIVLDHVKAWEVFIKVPEFLVLVTPLLGLKGNLEMTLASRLSTHANLGHLDTLQDKWNICFGNLCLTQVQAIVVGFLASVVALLMGLIESEKNFHWNHAILLCATSILTAAITSCALGILMVIVILLSKKLKLNPDNIATPIAASLGDITTLGLLSFFASLLYDEMISRPWLSPLIIGMYVLVTPFWVWISYRNEFTRKVLKSGWPPVVIAMLISSGGGALLDLGASKFADKPIQLPLFQPIVNGVGGNLVSIQASRISTSLHRDAVPGTLPGTLPGAKGKIWASPWAVFFKQGVQSVAARVLLLMEIPGHTIFITVIYFVSRAGDSDNKMETYPFLFVFLFIVAAFIQISFLLWFARILINWFWLRKIDPDTSTIPYLTALGDLIGTGLLFLVFELLILVGEL